MILRNESRAEMFFHIKMSKLHSSQNYINATILILINGNAFTLNDLHLIVVNTQAFLCFSVINIVPFLCGRSTLDSREIVLDLLRGGICTRQKHQ